jgi:hypothetical protein
MIPCIFTCVSKYSLLNFYQKKVEAFQEEQIFPEVKYFEAQNIKY